MGFVERPVAHIGGEGIDIEVVSEAVQSIVQAPLQAEPPRQYRSVRKNFSERRPPYGTCTSPRPQDVHVVV